MKKRAYILVFSAKRDRDDVKHFLDSHSEVLDWFSCFRNAFFLVSTSTAEKLAQAYHEQFADGAKRVFIGHLDDDRQGWLPKRAWDLIETSNNEDD